MKYTFVYSKEESRLVGRFSTRLSAVSFAKHLSLRKYNTKNNKIRYNTFLFLNGEEILKYVSQKEIDYFDLIELLNNFPLSLTRSCNKEHVEQICKRQENIIDYLENINSYNLYQLILPYLTFDGKKTLEYCTGLWENQSYLSNELIELIFNIVAKVYSMDVLSFKHSRRRLHTVVKPRFCSMWFLKKKTRLSLEAIGTLFGTENFKGYDHSTVHNGIQTYQDLIDTDRETKIVHKRISDLLDHEFTKLDARLLLS